jgi:hypothetical protein
VVFVVPLFVAETSFRVHDTASPPASASAAQCLVRMMVTFGAREVQRPCPTRTGTSVAALRAMSPARALACAQSAVFVSTGIWPALHMRSFERVTGPKRERWLVKTMGLFIAAAGAALGAAAASRSREVPGSTVVLGAASAATLAACDVVFAAEGRIRKVYLLDAALESLFVAGWLAVALGRRRATRIDPNFALDL